MSRSSQDSHSELEVRLSKRTLSCIKLNDEDEIERKTAYKLRFQSNTIEVNIKSELISRLYVLRGKTNERESYKIICITPVFINVLRPQNYYL